MISVFSHALKEELCSCDLGKTSEGRFLNYAPDFHGCVGKLAREDHVYEKVLF